MSFIYRPSLNLLCQWSFIRVVLEAFQHNGSYIGFATSIFSMTNHLLRLSSSGTQTVSIKSECHCRIIRHMACMGFVVLALDPHLNSFRVQPLQANTHPLSKESTLIRLKPREACRWVCPAVEWHK